MKINWEEMSWDELVVHQNNLMNCFANIRDKHNKEQVQRILPLLRGTWKVIQADLSFLSLERDPTQEILGILNFAEYFERTVVEKGCHFSLDEERMTLVFQPCGDPFANNVIATCKRLGIVVTGEHLSYHRDMVKFLEGLDWLADGSSVG